MAFQISPKFDSQLPIDVSHIVTRPGCTLAELAQQPVCFGRNSVALGELFSIQQVDDDCDFCWAGQLKNVHGIGFGLAGGKLVVKSDCGRHLGSRMTVGTIECFGNAGDFVGTSLRGGSIRIHGSAGDLVGSGFSGDKLGMRNGEILISRDAGHSIGKRMRRGLIFVGGSAGQRLGESMRAGTIVVVGRVGEGLGNGMKRGTILVPNDQPQVRSKNFRFSSLARNPVCRLVGQRLIRLGIKSGESLVADPKLQLFAGDQTYGGRGEVFFG